MTLNERLNRWLRGNVDAVRLILQIHEIYELWDDLIDKDKPTGDERINRALYLAMVELPRNAFYREHFALLSPVIEMSIIDWWTANTMECGGTEKLRHAWGLRFSPLAITAMAARIIGGPEYAAAVNAEFRSIGEPWSKYAAEHGVNNGLA